MNKATENGVTLSEVERELIEFFVRMAGVLSLPRSVGEIYGLLFISPGPLCLDDCRRKLKISKGSTSQGLRILQSFGAIRKVYVPGDRKDYFEPELHLRKMASGFANEQIQPHVCGGRERLDRINELLRKQPENENLAVLKERVRILENWQKRAQQLLPLVLKLIQ